MTKEYCAECGKPLGSTVDKCFECGGEGTRAGDPIPPHEWQVRLGVPPEKLKQLNFAARNIDNPEHNAHHAAGGSDD